jgi:hypothetical protein
MVYWQKRSETILHKDLVIHGLVLLAALKDSVHVAGDTPGRPVYHLDQGPPPGPEPFYDSRIVPPIGDAEVRILLFID